MGTVYTHGITIISSAGPKYLNAQGSTCFNCPCAPVPLPHVLTIRAGSYVRVCDLSARNFLSQLIGRSFDQLAFYLWPSLIRPDHICSLFRPCISPLNLIPFVLVPGKCSEVTSQLSACVDRKRNYKPSYCGQLSFPETLTE
jgi:hypothetical protein